MRRTNSSGILIQTDHLISAKRADLITIYKKERTCKIANFAVPVDYRENLWNARRGISTLFLLGNCKTVKQESDDCTSCNLCSWYIHPKIGTKTWGFEHNGVGRDSPNHGIVEIGQNAEKSPGDLRRLSVTQTPLKNHKLTLMCKLSRRKIMKNRNYSLPFKTNCLSKWTDA